MYVYGACLFYVYFYVCCCGNVCCVAAVVKDSGFLFCLSAISMFVKILLAVCILVGMVL